MVAYAKRVLGEYFKVCGLDTHWGELSRALAVVNAFKHGPGRKFDSVLKEHPEYFYVPMKLTHLPVVSINAKQLQQLINSIEGFWSDLSLHVEYRV